MKKNLNDLLYASNDFGEVSFTSCDGIKMAPGDQFPLTTGNRIPAIPASENFVRVSRIGRALEKSPNFVLGGYDANNCAYGTMNAVGNEIKWKTDGNTVWCTLNTDDEEYLSDAEIYRLFLFPLVAWYEPTDPITKPFRALYQAHKANRDDCIKFSAAFHYGYAVNHAEVEVVTGCSDSKCLPSVDHDVVVDDNGAKTETPTNGLPWQVESNIPNNLSVDSAINGRYDLKGSWGLVKEGDKSYNFGDDMIAPSELADYIDNPDFHDCMQQVIGYIGSLFRTNNIVWDGNTPINEFIKDIPMKRSNQQNMMLAGEPGSGKTLLCRMMAAALGMPCAVIRLSERFEKDELTQEVIATEHGFDSLKSQLYWYVKYGGIVLFDDLSNADANMFFSITGGLFENPYEYVVNQTKVKRHPLCIMLATTNVGTIGSQPMNEALLTRFGGHYVVEKLADSAFKECIITRAQSNAGITVNAKTQKAVADWTFNVFNSVAKAVKTVDAETADRLITMRAAIGTAEKILDAIADGFVVDSKKFATQTMANILYTGGNPALQKAVADAIESVPALRM